jgi:hypothetical protein
MPMGAGALRDRAARGIMRSMAQATNLDRELGSYLSLRTFKKDGTGVDTPVWFAESGGKLYVFTEARAYKVKRLRRNSRVQVARCGAMGAVSGAWIDGGARVVSDRRLVEHAYAALRAKYGWQMRLVDLLSWLAGRIDKRAILEIELAPRR